MAPGVSHCTHVCYLLLSLRSLYLCFTHITLSAHLQIAELEKSSCSQQILFPTDDKFAAGMNQCSPNDCSCPTSSDPTSVCPCFSVTNGQYHCEATASGAVLLQGPGYNSAGSCTGQTTTPACKDSGLALSVNNGQQHIYMSHSICAIWHCIMIMLTNGNIHQPFLIGLPAAVSTNPVYMVLR